MKRSFAQQHRAYTLLELVIASASAGVLLVGLGSTVVLATRALRPENTASVQRGDAAQVEHDLLSDLRQATGFTERTDKAATFYVPDRDGDNRPELLRYAWSGTAGDALTYSQNGGAAVTLLSDVSCFSLNYLTASVNGAELPGEQEAGDILLLVSDSNNPLVYDLTRKSLIESFGFKVAMFGLNDAPDKVIEAALQSKAIYIGGAVNVDKFDYAEKFAALEIGVVNEHAGLAPVLGFAKEAATEYGMTLDFDDTSHYITGAEVVSLEYESLLTMFARVESEPVESTNVVAKSWIDMHRLSGVAESVNSLASLNGAPVLATLDPGEIALDGGAVAARRVMLPWGDEKFDPNQLTASGQTLTRRAIEWAMGQGEASTEFKQFGYPTVFASSNSAANQQMATKATLPEKGRLVSISAYVGGVNDKLRFAIYKNNVGQPGSLIAQTEVGYSSTSMAWVTLPVTPIDLAADDYWLAFSFASSSQKYRYVSSYSDAGERNKSHAAVGNGFLSKWGKSDNSYNGARSIYATYEVLK